MIFRSIEAGLNSNVGCKRKNNQDNALASRGVYVVCDGMGGGKGGERASAQVAACFSQLAEQPSRNRTSIEHALSQSQQQVLELGQELGGIAGTTITGVVLPTRVEDSVHEQAIDEYCYVINVGDSRTYHMRADAEGHWMAESLTRITRDHSERQNAIDTGEMLPDEANRCIPRNIITQCVGAPDGALHRTFHHLLGWPARADRSGTARRCGGRIWRSASRRGYAGAVRARRGRQRQRHRDCA